MWMIGNFDVIAELKTFWEVSVHLARSQGNISDTRILALHCIFPFLFNQKDFIMMYLDHHVEVLYELKALTMGRPPISFDMILWCYSLTAYEKGDDTGILATNMLVNIPWYTKIDTTTCEVKPPSKQGTGGQSGFVKLGLEMRGMLNKMLDAAFDPDDLWHFLTTLRPTTPLPRPQLLLLFQVAGSTLQVIWRSHWAFHFRDVPFVVSMVFGQVVEELSRIRLLCASASKAG
ncbi:hypothetical protein [Absidia glauca]|uniref:Uncharacterized protein n=1 Tax=Absidia glauca TaxID=4829 RepID=A0A168LDR5_ABSGL|nr:hypothetical protein [Absidia glauca]